MAFLTIFILTGLLVGCFSKNSFDIQSLTDKKGLTPFTVDAAPFVLTGWHKMGALTTDRDATKRTLRIYIEGDGRARISKYKISANPTPQSPVALQLAGLDAQQNSGSHVVYLARPCQFTPVDKTPQNTATCRNKKWWSTHRYDAETLSAYMHVLDMWAKDFSGETSYELVGFSGGAAIAMQLAALRDDITNIRTVAGNLNPGITNAYHRVTPMPATFDVWKIADISPKRLEKLAAIPQLHVVGGKDSIIPAQLTYEVLKAYRATPVDDGCTRVKVLTDVTHLRGWDSHWGRLLRMPFAC